MLASMIFLKEPFFHGQDNYDQVQNNDRGVCACQSESNAKKANSLENPTFRFPRFLVCGIAGTR